MKTWRYIEEENVSAGYGLATDEYLMQGYGEENEDFPATLRLYTYRNYCALVGRFQNIQAELELETCRKENVQYGRRLTGGGAIIMGEDQLGICLATSSKAFEWQHLRELYLLFSKPIILALKKMGIPAGFRSKNDLEVNGKKIAGLGVHVNPQGAIQFHTSLLVDLDIPQMLKVLQIPIQKYADKRKISSVEQRITTISRELERPVSLEEVRKLIKESFSNSFDIQFREKPISPPEKGIIERITKERYQDEDWIFQRSPQADMTGMSLKKTAAGLLRTYIGLKGITIKSVLITGDFFEGEDVFKRIESQLKWSPLDRKHIEMVIDSILEESGREALPFSSSDLLDAIWLAARRAGKENRFTYQGSCYYPEKKKGLS